MAASTARKAELISQLGNARARMTGHSRGARAHLHPGQKARALFKQHRVSCLGGAALVGLVLAKLPPRTKKVPAQRRKDREQLARAGQAGFVLGTLKLILDLIKPLLIAWATKRVGDVAKSTRRTERKVEHVEQQV